MIQIRQAHSTLAARCPFTFFDVKCMCEAEVKFKSMLVGDLTLFNVQTNKKYIVKAFARCCGALHLAKTTTGYIFQRKFHARTYQLG
jgi:hypothetical protein